LSSGPPRYDGSEPVSSPLGSIPPALGAALPQTPAPLGGLGAGGIGATGTPGALRGEVSP
jgi:hypothetical protein